MSALTLFGDGGSVRIDSSRGQGNEWLRLNDLHAASGGERGKEPSEWLSLKSTKALIAEQNGDSRSDCFRVFTGGTDPGTWAHWVIAVAYAQWLSPSFHLRTINEWAEYRRGGVTRVDSALANALENLTVTLATLSRRLDALESRDGSIVSSTQANELRRRVRHLAVRRVRCAFETSEASSRRVLYNKLGMALGWSGRGCSWDHLPLGRFPEARRLLDELETEIARSEFTHRKASQTTLPFSNGKH